MAEIDLVNLSVEHIWKSQQIYNKLAVRRHMTNPAKNNKYNKNCPIKKITPHYSLPQLVHRLGCLNSVCLICLAVDQTVHHHMDSNSDDVLGWVESETFSIIPRAAKYLNVNYLN